MDMSSAEWLFDLAMEDPASLIHHCQMMMSSSQQVSSDGVLNTWYDTTEFMCADTKTTSLTTYDPPSSEAMWDQLKVAGMAVAETNSGWSSCASSSHNSGQLISFGSSECDNNNNNDEDVMMITPNYKEEPVYYGEDVSEDYLSALKKNKLTHHQKQKKRVIGTLTSGVCTQEHVLAERKRREKMACRFHALSALIPGLKKMDKASILEDAAKYLKQLEEQVKMLEEKTSKRIVESVVLVKKMQDENHLNDGNSSSDENFNGSMNGLLEVEAKASNKNVLIRIHTQKLEGLSCKVLHEIEKLHLTTLNCNTMSFGGYATDITVVAKMNNDFSLTMKDLVKHMRQALQQFSCLQK